MNTLACPIEFGIRGHGVAPVEEQGTALMTPLEPQSFFVSASCPVDCAGRIMKQHIVTAQLNTALEMVIYNSMSLIVILIREVLLFKSLISFFLKN